MDEFDVGDGRVGVVCHFLLQVFHGFHHSQVHFDAERLLFGGSLEMKFDHLKNISNC